MAKMDRCRWFQIGHREMCAEVMSLGDLQKIETAAVRALVEIDEYLNSYQGTVQVLMLSFQHQQPHFAIQDLMKDCSLEQMKAIRDVVLNLSAST